VGDRIGALTLVDYDVVVRVGSTTIFSANSATDNSLRPYNDNGRAGAGSGAPGAFKNVSRTFQSTATGPIEISFGAGGAFTTTGGLVAFDNIQLSVSAGGLQGDFNADGKVDAADYTVWRDNLGGSSAALNGAGSGSPTVVQADYTVWETNYGLTAATAIPEPGALVSMLGCVACLVARRLR
jgi:hypothetical protein